MKALSPWFETARLISWIRKVRSEPAGPRPNEQVRRNLSLSRLPSASRSATRPEA